jgi:hypothetical protein
MAFAPDRSMNAELSEGMTDGKYKKVIRDRGAFVEASTQLNRTDLSDAYYGIHEERTKTLPDGLVHQTPNFVPTASVER